MTLTSTRNSTPFGFVPFFELQRELDRVFGNTPGESGCGSGTSFTPALDVREGNDGFQVSLELPGVNKNDVTVTYNDGVLSVKGERKSETQSTEGEIHRQERSYGSFERNVRLSKPIQSDAIKAGYKDGVLTIQLPKVPEAKPKQIGIDQN